MFIKYGDGVVTFANIIPGVIVGLAGGKTAGSVDVGVGTNNICHAVSVGVPLVHPSVADVVVIVLANNPVGFGHVGMVVKLTGPVHADGIGEHTTRT